jgi:uncharacterized membrane protein YfcA
VQLEPVFTAAQWPALAVMFAVGAIASAINAVAGGGSLISFPALVALGVPPLSANATNSVALWPGSLSGAIGFLNQFGNTKRHLRALLIPTVAGSVAGSLLLLNTPERVFDWVVPVLLLVATLLLAFQPHLKAWTARRTGKVPVWEGVALQGLVAVYGGYFGAGMGIMMLAVFGTFVEGTIHELNALKTWLGLAINLFASILFLWQGLVWIPAAVAMMLGAIAGGYAAARASQGMDSELLRKAIVVLGLAMTTWFTWQVVAV